MANMDRSNKSYWISTAFPSCIDDMIREALEEQELRFKQELLGVPQFKVNTVFPSCIDDMIREALEEQELRFKQELLGVPQFKVNTVGPYYFRQPWVICDNYIKPNCIVKLEKETNKMEAKKCDRCGKLYESNGDRARVRFKFKEVHGSDDLNEEAIAKRQLEEVYIKAYSTEIDLCPECKESFKKWFESDDKK